MVLLVERNLPSSLEEPAMLLSSTTNSMPANLTMSPDLCDVLFFVVILCTPFSFRYEHAYFDFRHFHHCLFEIKFRADAVFLFQEPPEGFYWLLRSLFPFSSPPECHIMLISKSERLRLDGTLFLPFGTFKAKKSAASPFFELANGQDAVVKIIVRLRR